MSITANTGAKNTSTNVTTVTLALPAGILVNDVMLLVVEVFCETGTTPAISFSGAGGGWTLIPMTTGVNPQVATAGSSIWNYAWAYYRVATTGDQGATLTITESGSAAGTTWMAAAVEAYTGASVTSPIDVCAGSNVQAQASVTAPSVTTTVPNDMPVYLCGAGINGAVLTGPGTSRQNNVSAAGIAAAVDDNNATVASGTVIGGGTWSQSGNSSDWFSVFTIGLAPPFTPPPPENPVPPSLLLHPLWEELLEVAAYRRDVAPAVATPQAFRWRLMDGVNGRPGNGPATATANSSAILLGNSFYCTQNAWFEGYRLWVCASGGQPTTPQKFALWSNAGASGGSVVPGTAITSGTLSNVPVGDEVGGHWNYIPLPVPVPVALYGSYAAVTATSGPYPDTPNQFGAGQPYAGGLANGIVRQFSDAGGGDPPPYSRFNPVSGTGTDPAASLPVTAIGAHDNIYLDVQVTNVPPAGYAGPFEFWPNMADADFDTDVDASVNYVIGTDVVFSEPVVVLAAKYWSPSGTAQFATSADIWNVRSKVRVATQGSPTWTGPSGAKASPGSGWLACQFPGAVYLPAGEYYATVYNGNGSPDGWGAKRLYYWEQGTTPGNTYLTCAPGANGIIAGPGYVPPTPLAPDIPDYSTGNLEPGQSVFAVGPPNQFPDNYVGASPSGTYSGPALFQNYWVGLVYVRASQYFAQAPVGPQPVPHPLWYRLLEVAAERTLPGRTAPSVSGSVAGAAAALAVAAPAGSVEADSRVAGVTGALILAAPAGSVAADGTVAGAAAALTLTAAAGNAAAGVNIGGTPAALALAAPAGSIAAGASIPGVTAPLALAAPAGAVSASSSVTGVTAALALGAAAGAAGAGTVVTGLQAMLAVAAPAGAVLASSSVAGVAAVLPLGAPAGALPAGGVLTLTASDTGAGVLTAGTQRTGGPS